MKVVPLVPDHDCERIASALRIIADDIEAGEYAFNPTLAILVLGTESVTKDREGFVDSYEWQTHGLGKGSFFAFRGLLASTLNSDGGSHD